MREGVTVRPLCIIFLESSLKTTETWYRIPLTLGVEGRREGHTHARTHTQDFHKRINPGWETNGVCDAVTQTRGPHKRKRRTVKVWAAPRLYVPPPMRPPMPPPMP